MPGIPTKFVVADLVMARMLADGSPQAQPLKDSANLPFFYLGALGATFGDLMAARPNVAAGDPNSPYFEVWRPVLRLLAGPPGTPGVYENLRTLRTTVDKLNSIVKKAVDGNPVEKDLQKLALLNMKDELEALPNVVTALQAAIATVTGLRTTIGPAIFGSRPRPKTAPSTAWTVRDTLHGSQTGRFLEALHKLAAEGDDQQKAYALGATIGYATDLCGNPFVGNVVRAPYRNHWWRHRWICNFIDTWVYGYYRLGGAASARVPASGVPTPLYTNWPNLCEANLQNRLGFAGLNPDALLGAVKTGGALPAPLPQSFVDFWQKAFSGVYGADPASVTANDENVQSACAMTWLILWIQTSGEVIPCSPGDQINYPDDCGARPPWVAVDGSVTTGNGTVQRPPQPEKDTDPSVSEIICGIVLALLAVSAWGAGMLIAAVEALVVAAAAVADAVTDPDWEQLRCHVGWTLAFQANFTNTLHDLLVSSGLGFPYTMALAHNDITFVNSGQVTPPDAALNTVRSRGRNSVDPASLWNATGNPASNWANPPVEPAEPPTELAYPTPATWPYHFVDGLELVPSLPPPAPQNPPSQLNPLAVSAISPVPQVRDPNLFAARRANLTVPGSVAGFFGNAVDVSLDLIRAARPKEFLNWDLDGDPGIGYPTWLEPTPTAPRSASFPEP